MLTFFPAGFCKTALPLLLGLLLPLTLQAQQTDSIDFPASQIAEISTRFAGSPQNWPIVNSLAEYDPQTNRFYLSAADINLLRAFRDGFAQVEESRALYTTLIDRGARVLAREELQTLEGKFDRFRAHVNEAAITAATETAAEIAAFSQDVSELVEARRLMQVEARLEEIENIVESRRGLLGRWASAETGDLLQQDDGIRTGEDSQARLEFVDGSDITLSANTTAVIRKSSVDRITNRSEVDIELSSGGVLTRLSAAARNQATYNLETPTSSSQINSSSFWAENRSDEITTMSNYDGIVLVSAGNMEVNLAENEGTIVRRGQGPSAPIRLLPAPSTDWARPDTVIYINRLDLAWQAVSGARRYEVDLARRDTFLGNVRTFRANEPQLTLTDIPTGLNYVRIRAFDENELRGIDSRTLQVLYVESTSPPPLILDSAFRPEVVYSFSRETEITGTTEARSRLQINGERVSVGPDGRFRKPLTITGEALEVSLTATNAAGLTREVNRTLRYVDTARLFDLNWSAPVQDGQLQRMPRMLVRGRAYAFLTIEAQINGQVLRQRAGNNGDWALQFEPDEAAQITIRFIDRESGNTVAERSFPFTPIR
ncbi:FecR family protein [Cyclonatronum proteinivorum]|uniref:FecR family protein n=1 Tax=Cyclonatronum proteinivorum TaxID=1457365 RepID=A0A345UMS1_9BACT|nr:FecR domain-containing protein [Cyclonatronum proteinivorum]AXJ01773.1 FecR family protein [Cyclonatronum proteinivorum]